MHGNLQKNIFKPSPCVGQEELRQYLSGGMSREGLRQVENHLLDCPLCSDAADGYEEMGLQQVSLLGDFDSFQKKMLGQSTATVRQLRPGGVLRWAVAMAAVLVVGVVAYLNLFKTPTGPQLYKQYYYAYENDIPFNLRRPGVSDVDPNFAQALTAYIDHNYSTAILLFERNLTQQPDNEAARFFAGMALLESNQTDKAAAHFGPVASGQGVYSRKAAWYLIMCDLKSDNKESAKARLDNFIKSGEFMNREAQDLRTKL